MTQTEFDNMMATYLSNQNKKPVSDWAKPYWDAAVKAKVFDGSSPQGSITREQAAKTYSTLKLI